MPNERPQFQIPPVLQLLVAVGFVLYCLNALFTGPLSRVHEVEQERVRQHEMKMAAVQSGVVHAQSQSSWLGESQFFFCYAVKGVEDEMPCATVDGQGQDMWLKERPNIEVTRLKIMTNEQMSGRAGVTKTDFKGGILMVLYYRQREGD